MATSKKITRIINISAEYKEACSVVKQIIFYNDGSSNYAFEQIDYSKENPAPPLFLNY